MKKLIIIIVCMIFTISMFLVGCIGEGTTSTSNTTTGSKSTTKSESTTESKSTTEESNLNSPGTFPIVKDNVTITALWPADAETPDVPTNRFLVWYEEKSNVTIDYQLVSDESLVEKTTILLASGDYPELFVACSITNNDVVKYSAEGVFLPLNDLIEQYGSNIKQAFAKYPDLKSLITTPDGNIYALPQVSHCLHCWYQPKMWINQGWLDQLGLETPVTTDDYYNVLKAFKGNDPNGNGKMDEIPLIGSSSAYHFMMNAFIYSNQSVSDFFYLNNDGQVAFNAIQPEWKEGLRYIRKLVEEGLFDETSFTITSAQLRTIQMGGDTQVIGSSVGGNPLYMLMSRDSEWVVDYEALAPLEGPNGVRQTPKTDYQKAIQGQFLITDKCENPEVAILWANGLMTDDVLIQSFGEEGSEWRKGNEGELDLHGNVAQFVRTLDETNEANQNNNAYYGMLPLIYSQEFIESMQYDPDPKNRGTESGNSYWLEMATVEKYVPYAPDNTYKPPFLTADVVSEAAQLGASINTYAKEAAARFLTGDLDIESEWDKYVEEMKSMGIERYVEIYNDAYQRQYADK